MELTPTTSYVTADDGTLLAVHVTGCLLYTSDAADE